MATKSARNKPLIGYHFGSQQGLVAAAAREVSQAMSARELFVRSAPAVVR